MFFLCAHSGLQNCEFFLVCHMFLTGWKTGMSESESDSKSKSESGTPKDSSSGNLCWRFVGVGFFLCNWPKPKPRAMLLEGLGQLGSWCSQEKAEIALVRRCCSGIQFSFATLPWFCRDKCQRELKLIQFHCPLAENVLGTNFRVGSEGQMSARAKISKISLPFSWKCVFFKFQGRIWGTNVNESQN